MVTVETDGGVTGIGEGGSKDTLEQCAGRLIGQDPHFIERLWQDMSRAFFYPPGREKMHALGALDLALWDIKGKVQGLPVHALLGGMVRNYCECYNTAGSIPGDQAGHEPQGARAGSPSRRAIAPSAWARPIRPATPRTTRASGSTSCTTIACRCAKAWARTATWCIDFHQRFDLDEAVRGCDLIEGPGAVLRRRSGAHRSVPGRPAHPAARWSRCRIAAGEEWGNRWDFNKLVESHDIDFLRATLPNVGGITEMMKIAAICETHFVGIVPHFTGPDRHRGAGEFPGHFLRPGADGVQLPGPHASRICRSCLDFKDGKLYPNDRPGLGVELDLKPLKQIAEITEPITQSRADLFPAGRVDHQLVIMADTMSKTLEGKVAVITGASRGLGKAMALALGGAGAKLALVARDRGKLEETAAEAAALGAEAAIFLADVTDAEQVAALTGEVASRFGRWTS